MDWNNWKENYTKWTRSVHAHLCGPFSSIFVCFSSFSFANLYHEQFLSGRGITRMFSKLELTFFLSTAFNMVAMNFTIHMVASFISFFLYPGTLQAHIFLVEMQKRHLSVLETRSVASFSALLT